jgi:hypothetical protein
MTSARHARRPPGPGEAQVHVRAVAHLVTIWPEDHVCADSSLWCLLVTCRGPGQWAVERGWSSGRKAVLTRSGRWAGDEPGDPAARFTLDEALALAAQHAPLVTVRGVTATQQLRAHARHGCPSQYPGPPPGTTRQAEEGQRRNHC